MSEAWTSLKLIQWTTGYFEKAEIPNPRLDAELLLSHVLKCRRIDLYTRHEDDIGEKFLTPFKALIQRRIKREPLQHILGGTEFYGLKFKVTPAVLIPRPETELLVEEVLSDRSDGSGRSDKSILEIGTGSGCIAIALAKKMPSARIIATDISTQALEVARENAIKNEVAERIEWILADIAPWRRFMAEERRFDLIVSNPPYIPTGEFPNLQPEVRDFDPRMALDGGPEGLDTIEKILGEAAPFLKPEGWLILEIGEGQRSAIEHLIKNQETWAPEKTRKDYLGVDRIIVFRKH